MPIAVGDRLPDVTFRTLTESGPKPVSTADLFAGKTMVLFGVPGAFTPTCHNTHLPGFLKEAEAFKAKGVAGIAVVAVNDPFVMGAWAKETGGAGAITFLSDGNAEFAKATGLDVDLSMAGLGIRCRRFSMLVEDGVVRKINIEEAPGKAELSSASTLICQL
ncbi:peroxiredoxin [Rhabdaerophilum calidifontis]|uniref:peroxiredoxin n=1 Tax=Rhabdaerophilum calidifontis TaxID=2604328 RepID=UPI001238BADC|nr:peroxiredoxin [Rhabdaerophilum calidifontis]